MRQYPTCTVTPKAEKSIRRGHPWIYADEITAIDEGIPNGELVDVRSPKGAFLGTGLLSERSKIRVRIISNNANDRFDEAFWRRRVSYALRYRRTVMPGDDFESCRLIFGESDQFPGLVVDRFGDVLCAQVMSVGLEMRKGLIFRLIVEELAKLGGKVSAIYERADTATRTLEGLEQGKWFHSGIEGLRDDLDGHVTIRENGLLFDVNYIDGQKTGYFLDQKYNRKAIMRIAEGRRVLDCFTHTGSFAIHAAAAEASKVTAVDVSKTAIDQARKNADSNGADINFICANVFDLLGEEYEAGRREYDFIILDPPAFTKSNSTTHNAYKGYKEINLKAMRLLPRGGYLATCSCSHFMRDELFRQMLAEASADAGVALRQVEARQQSPDHPILLSVPETDYLKFYIFQVV